MWPEFIKILSDYGDKFFEFVDRPIYLNLDFWALLLGLGNLILLFLNWKLLKKYTQATEEIKGVSLKGLLSNSWGLLIPDVENTYVSIPTTAPQDINIRLFFKNIGHGPLTLKKVRSIGFQCRQVVGDARKIEPYIEPRGLMALWENRIVSVQDKIETDFILKVPQWYSDLVVVNFAVDYEDALGKYEHKITINIKNAKSAAAGIEIKDKGKLMI